jgi:hypothetical protein
LLKGGSQLANINKDYYGGVLMIILGLGTVFKSLGYHIGSLAHMGPGYFPAAIGVLLTITGVLIAISGIGKTNHLSKEALPPEWRGWLCIIGGIIAFIVLGEFTGLLPASFAIVFISAMGDRKNTVKAAFILSVAMSIVAVVVFWWALQLQFPLIRWG